jgi:hypothetical protein
LFCSYLLVLYIFLLILQACLVIQQYEEGVLSARPVVRPTFVELKAEDEKEET